MSGVRILQIPDPAAFSNQFAARFYHVLSFVQVIVYDNAVVPKTRGVVDDLRFFVWGGLVGFLFYVVWAQLLSLHR